METDSRVKRRTLLVPVATLGVGKTTVGVALSHLYGTEMGHIQNDEIPASKTKKRQFVDATLQLLEDHTIVLMDRNNAEKRERAQVFRDIVMSSDYEVQFVALNFLPQGPGRNSRRKTRQLVLARGNKHQTIRDMPEALVRKIMGDFESRFQKLDRTEEPDCNFNEVIELEPGESLQNIHTTVAALHKLRVPGDLQFTDDEIVAAYNAALSYEPRTLGKKV